MKSPPRISETEWEIMEVLWEESPMTSQQVIDRLCANEYWHPQTTRTLMNRLVNKGALRTQRQGRAYLYWPKVNKSDCVTVETETFLGRVFGGTLKPMIAHLVQKKKLSRKEIEELKRVLDGKE